MSCTRPLNCFRSPQTGKIYFSGARGLEPFQVPCGQCIGCRLERSRDWAVRCVHESKLYSDNCFLTLTYNNENLPANKSLDKSHLTKFFKRLRKQNPGKKIRYFACGEYGDEFQRPHYHVILFNHDFNDKRLYKYGEFPLYTSSTLAGLWPFGHAIVAAFSFESAAYTARYCVKKVNGAGAKEHYGDRIPEYAVMSRKPGIGYDFFLKYYDDIVHYDRVVTRGGVQSKPPRYYDKLLRGFDDDIYLRNKENRLENAKYENPWRLQDLDKFNEIKFNQQLRSYENG